MSTVIFKDSEILPEILPIENIAADNSSGSATENYHSGSAENVLEVPEENADVNSSVTVQPEEDLEKLRYGKVTRLSYFGFFVYFLVAITGYLLLRKKFSGAKTNKIVDALYFSIVTMSTVGYGDIVPDNNLTKILTIILVSIGVIALDYMFWVVNNFINLGEKYVAGRIESPTFVLNGKIRLIWKFGVALSLVLINITIGAVFIHFFENLGTLDSIYFSFITVSTVGFGDEVFKTAGGRAFATVWIVFSAISMAVLFYVIGETRVAVPTTKVDDTMRESMHILRRLKEIGKITDEDINMVLSEVQVDT